MNYKEVIELGYKHARYYLRKMGRRDIDFRDIAHEVFVRAVRVKTPPPEHLEKKIRWMVKSVFRDFYTNTTTRKKDVMLEATHEPIERTTWHENHVDAADEFRFALKRMYSEKPHWVELLVDGRSLPEIAAERNVSTQAVHDQKTNARNKIKAILDEAA